MLARKQSFKLKPNYIPGLEQVDLPHSFVDDWRQSDNASGPRIQPQDVGVQVETVWPILKRNHDRCICHELSENPSTGNKSYTHLFLDWRLLPPQYCEGPASSQCCLQTPVSWIFLKRIQKLGMPLEKCPFPPGISLKAKVHLVKSRSRLTLDGGGSSTYINQ